MQAEFQFSGDAGLSFSAGEILEMVGDHDSNWLRVRKLNGDAGHGLAPKSYLRNLSGDMHL